jgi:DNA-binding PadR family transcriptional regulator
MMAQCDMATDLVRCVVLMILYEKPMHGYAILEALQERLGRNVGTALVYPFLAQMSAAGYLTSRAERTGKRRRTVYSLTRKGKRFCENVFGRLSRIVSVAVQSNIHRCSHCGSKLFEPGHVAKVGRRQLTFCCVHCARAYKY